MKVSEQWLREWVNPDITTEELCSKLTLIGLEVESIGLAAEPFEGVVIGKVVSVNPHPEADRLTICNVDVGQEKLLSIVCGAKNIKEGMKVPTALLGAKLPHNKEIIQSEIRGIVSEGMLCSAYEVGISELQDGLLKLPHNAPIGQSIWEYLKLNDRVLEIGITPNRGDCLSLLGLAQEVSAITQSPLHIPPLKPVKSDEDTRLLIQNQAPKACPHYVGRIIKDIKADVTTPMWMQERLRRSGLKSINPVVDVMNYVMLELGQPLHAFDLNTIKNKIEIRFAKEGETLTLLNGDTIELQAQSLIIADAERPLALAGIMGGLDSSVTLLTKSVFLESAFFIPEIILKSTKAFNISTDSAYRFERGVDPTLQKKAIERATELLLEIVGGDPGPILENVSDANLPEPVTIILRKQRLQHLLGITISPKDVETILSSLGMRVSSIEEGWEVGIPPRRFDLASEIDLIEEVIRFYGFDKLPNCTVTTSLKMNPRVESNLPITRVREVLVDQGYNEVITYSFVDEKLHALLDPEREAKKLLNPITAEMSVMRTSLWPGLINSLLYNQNRQQNRLKLFEIGLRFVPESDTLKQESVLSGLVAGLAFPEQWGESPRNVDFFDVKGHIENILKCTLNVNQFSFKPSSHPALHPGQTVEIGYENAKVGLLGSLHPTIKQNLGISMPVILFELRLDYLCQSTVPKFAEISKFPEIRRDLAILVDDTVPAGLIQDTIKEVVGNLLRDVHVFDVYQGEGIPPNQKSIALSLFLQHDSRTLRDEEIASLMETVVEKLKDEFTAVLR